MSYKKLWIALALVLIISFSRAGRGGHQGHATTPLPSLPRWSPPTARCYSPAPSSRTARTSGSPSAARKSAPSGAMAPTSLPTGAPTGCTASRVFILDRWAGRTGAPTMPRFGVEQQAALQARACKRSPAAIPMTRPPNHHARPGSCRGLRRAEPLLRRRFRQRPQRIRHSAGALTDPAQAARRWRILLVDGMGR